MNLRKLHVCDAYKDLPNSSVNDLIWGLKAAAALKFKFNGQAHTPLESIADQVHPDE